MDKRIERPDHTIGALVLGVRQTHQLLKSHISK